MKRCIVLVSAALLLAGTVFAGGGGESGGSGATGGVPRIGVTIYKFDDTFMSTVRLAIDRNAKGKAQVEIVDSQNAQPTQNDQIDSFFSKNVKALAINPVDRTAASTIIAKAKTANVPVVFFNREPLPADMNSWDKVYYSQST